MNSLREKITQRGTADCPFQHYHMTKANSNKFFANIHWHPELEILYMRSGRIEIRAGKHTFPIQEGQIAFIASGELHAIRCLQQNSTYDAFVYSLNLLTLPESHFFQRELILPLQLGSLRFPTVLTPEDTGYSTVTEALNEICNTNKNSQKYKHTVFYSMIKLYLSLADQLIATGENHLQRSNATVKACLKYMNDNHTHRLTLQQLAQHVHLHPNYLCALFKDYTGQTVFQHLTQIRIEHAAQILRNSNTSISDVAAACGFENSSFFSRKFKQIIGVSPKEYSLHHK